MAEASEQRVGISSVSQVAEHGIVKDDHEPTSTQQARSTATVADHGVNWQPGDVFDLAGVCYVVIDVGTYTLTCGTAAVVRGKQLHLIEHWELRGFKLKSRSTPV